MPAHDKRLIVILNDNDMSIAPPVGAMSAYLTALSSLTGLYPGLRHREETGARCPPRKPGAPRRGIHPRHGDGRHAVRGARLLLCRPDRRAQSRPAAAGARERAATAKRADPDPRRDQKGKGYAPAENAADKYHGVSKFDVITGEQAKPKPNAPSYTKVFARR
jgi:1-deoxy-D-xylulose-5-phosphate synthase